MKYNTGLIVRDADLRCMVAAVRTAAAAYERFLGPVVGAAVRVEDASAGLGVEILIAEEAKIVGYRAGDLGLVHMKHGWRERKMGQATGEGAKR